MADNPTTYPVGLATADITPPVGIQLAGFSSRQEPSTGVYHPLRAVAAAVGDDDTGWLLVSIEWLGFYEHTPRVRRSITQATGVPGDRITLLGTHTHCGPAFREMDAGRHGKLDDEHIDDAIERMVQCAAAAWRGREPARLRIGVGACDFAVSRRKPDGKGGVLWQPHAGGPLDHDVPVIAVESANGGGLRGAVFGYACHPTSRAGTLIGGDYVAFACDAIEAAHPGAVACFVQGCAGDQKPHPVDPAAEGFDRRSVEQVCNLGEELGSEVNRVIAAGGRAPLAGSIRVAQRRLELETEPPDLDELKRAADSEHGYERAWAAHLLERVGSDQPPSRHVPFEVQTIRFGTSLAIVTLSGEMTVEYALRLKRDLGERFEHVMVLGYANDIVGYVPVRRQIPEAGYEVTVSNQYYKRTGPYVAATEDLICSTARRLLAD